MALGEPQPGLPHRRAPVAGPWPRQPSLPSGRGAPFAQPSSPGPPGGGDCRPGGRPQARRPAREGPPVAGQEAEESGRRLASPAAQLLPPHQPGAEQQRRRQPGRPGDLPVHTAPFPFLPHGSGGLEEHDPSQPVLQQQLPEDLRVCVPGREPQVPSVEADPGGATQTPGGGAGSARGPEETSAAEHGQPRTDEVSLWALILPTLVSHGDTEDAICGGPSCHLQQQGQKEESRAVRRSGACSRPPPPGQRLASRLRAEGPGVFSCSGPAAAFLSMQQRTGPLQTQWRGTGCCLAEETLRAPPPVMFPLVSPGHHQWEPGQQTPKETNDRNGRQGSPECPAPGVGCTEAHWSRGKGRWGDGPVVEKLAGVPPLTVSGRGKPQDPSVAPRGPCSSAGPSVRGPEPGWLHPGPAASSSTSLRAAAGPAGARLGRAPPSSSSSSSRPGVSAPLRRGRAPAREGGRESARACTCAAGIRTQASVSRGAEPRRPTSRGVSRGRPEPRPLGSAAREMAAGGAAGLFRCPLCRRTAFSGRRSHLYSAGHQRRLRAVLARLREKVAAARKTLRQALAVPYDPAEHERPVWCACCRQEVKQHLSHGAVTALHGGLVAHLASPEHKRAVCTFWWENKADPALKCQFLISSEDYELFKASLTKALDAYEASKDEVIQQLAAHIRKVEDSRQEMVRSFLEPQTETELCKGVAVVRTCTRTQSDFSFAAEDSAQPGPRRSATSAREQLGSPCSAVLELDWQEARQSLTFIGHQETQGKGNVHTGAKPPWLLEEEEEKSTRQIGPSYEEFLKEKEKQKLKQLPPHRVGANFDHTSQTGEGWLPSFGRVWNHGRRWQSRHQFPSRSRTEKVNSEEKANARLPIKVEPVL